VLPTLPERLLRVPRLEDGVERRQAIFDFVKQYITEHGYAPSLADIARASGLHSRSAARKHVLILCREGRLKVDPKVARSITLGEA
jgi:repressor LexA